jgi:acetyl-CoA carboxylase biotin carboxyl carrier protein
MTDLKTLKQLVKLMSDNDLTELDLRDEQTEVHLKRGHAPPAVQFVPGQAGAMPTQAGAVPPPAPQASGAGDVDAAGAAAGEAANRVTIDSPMVGTFFAAPNPDSQAFVSVGDPVDDETVVCLIEAMKVFNEIKAETTGTIAKMLVENGQAVEYGEPMFEITPG